MRSLPAVKLQQRFWVLLFFGQQTWAIKRFVFCAFVVGLLFNAGVLFAQTSAWGDLDPFQLPVFQYRTHRVLAYDSPNKNANNKEWSVKPNSFVDVRAIVLDPTPATLLTLKNPVVVRCVRDQYALAAGTTVGLRSFGPNFFQIQWQQEEKMIVCTLPLGSFGQKSFPFQNFRALKGWLKVEANDQFESGWLPFSQIDATYSPVYGQSIRSGAPVLLNPPDRYSFSLSQVPPWPAIYFSYWNFNQTLPHQPEHGKTGNYGNRVFIQSITQEQQRILGFHLSYHDFRAKEGLHQKECLLYFQGTLQGVDYRLQWWDPVAKTGGQGTLKFLWSAMTPEILIELEQISENCDQTGLNIIPQKLAMFNEPQPLTIAFTNKTQTFLLNRPYPNPTSNRCLSFPTPLLVLARQAEYQLVTVAFQSEFWVLADDVQNFTALTDIQQAEENLAKQGKRVQTSPFHRIKKNCLAELLNP